MDKRVSSLCLGINRLWQSYLYRNWQGFSASNAARRHYTAAVMCSNYKRDSQRIDFEQAWPPHCARFHTSTPSQPLGTNESQVTAHMLGMAMNSATLRSELESLGAAVVQRDNFTLVEHCKELGHEKGAVFIGNNGVIVLWHDANALYPEYRKVLQKSVLTPLKLPNSTVSEFSESIDIKEGTSSYIQKGVIYMPKEHTISELTAISLALMSAVQLNHLELSIRINLMISDDILARLRKSVSKKNLDKLTERLFEFQTYAHRTRYLLNLECDPLEIPDALWDNENLCNLFMATQATFDLPQRLEKLNHRISWELDSLQSHSEYIRHKHSSRLEKIIIIVITLELALGLSQALYKFF